MKNSYVYLIVLILFQCCSNNHKMYTYSDLQFSIKIPKGWQIDKKIYPFMPISVKSTDTLSQLNPNFNVVLMDKTKSLKEITIENSNNNCKNGICNKSEITLITINTQKCVKTYQDIFIEHKSITIQQYYFEKDNTVFMVSFYCLKEDLNKYNDMFNDIILSFQLQAD